MTDYDDDDDNDDLYQYFFTTGKHLINFHTFCVMLDCLGKSGIQILCKFGET